MRLKQINYRSYELTDFQVRTCHYDISFICFTYTNSFYAYFPYWMWFLFELKMYG